MSELDLFNLRRNVARKLAGNGMSPAARFLEQPSTSSAAIADSQNAFARQGLQAGALAEANRGMSNVEAARLRALKALGASQQPTAAITKPRLLTPTSAASGAGSLLPGRGTPGSAALGAFGQTMSQLGGWQDKPMTFGQILGASLGEARKAYGTAEERQRQIAADKAAAERQAEQDALTKRYREAQIAQMQGKKEGDIKIGSIVKLPLEGDMVQDQMWDGTKFVNRGEPYSRFSPKTPAVQILPEDKAAAKRAEAVGKYVTDFLSRYDKDVMNARQLSSEYGVIQDMLTSAEDIDTGPITEMILPLQRVMGELGFLSEGEMNEVNTLTTLDAKMKYIVPRMREEGSGSTSNFEMGVFKSAAPGLAKTREANILLAAMARQAAQHKINVQDMRRKLALGDGTTALKIPSDKEVGEAVEAEYGSIFKTPFGRQINKKDFADVEAELDSMIADGRVNIGDVVYLGKHYQGADGKTKNGGFYVVSAEDV